MKLAILGTGQWGLTLAWLLSNNFRNISVWGRNPETVDSLNKLRKFNLPIEFSFNQNISFTTDLNEAIFETDFILMVISTSGIREVCQKLSTLNLKNNQILINTSKGLELPSLKRMSEVIKEELPNINYAVLSGPTLAKEILLGLPTAATVASYDINIATIVQKYFNVNSKFRLYTNKNVIAVELGGSLKNVIAIASGFAYSMKLGENAKGALLTRGMAEIIRIASVFNADIPTLYGLSGMGDLIATCSSFDSRNFKVGLMLGQGLKIDQIQQNLGCTAEGIKTSKAVCQLAKSYNIETPIANAIYEAIYTDISPEDVLFKLMNRKLKSEHS